MPILSKQDTFKVEYASLISDYDYDIILDLYMPIIGYKASLIYFKLLSLAKRHIYKNMLHDDLFTYMQISVADFASERQKLEAIGLLTTYFKIGNDSNEYVYILYAPKTPDEFFDNVLYKGLLNEHLDKRKVQELENIYAISEIVKKDNSYKEITTHFGEIYKPDFSASYFKNIINDNLYIGHKSHELDLSFDYDVFLKHIQANSQINRNVFTKTILSELKKLCSLYGINEETCARYVIECFDPTRENGDKINFERLNILFQEDVKYPAFTFNNKSNNSESNELSSNSQLGQKVNMMEKMSPKEFLTILQDNVIPVKPDLDLIADLSNKVGLRNCVINAIIDYTLQVNNNVLSRPYVLKIAASLKRENITSAYDAMNYLNKPKRRKSLKSKTQEKDITSTINEETKTTSEEEDVSWDDLIKNFN